MPPPPPDPARADRERTLCGRVLDGRYRVDDVLGKGGMGTVYLGHDLKVDRRVVVKVPHERFLAEEGFRERFAREIRSLTELEHPHIVRVHDFGEVDDVPYAVLQYLAGGSLRDRQRTAGGRLTPEEVATWLPAVAAALDFMHTAGVVHRDVKPANILFDAHGHPFLADFGIVKALASSDTGLTQTGATPGSPDYMAPDVLTGGRLLHSYDQYSLGVVVYEMLSARLPHLADTPLMLLYRKQTEPPPHLALLAPQVPAACVAAVMRAIERDAPKRFPTCAAFAEAFVEGRRAHAAEARASSPSDATSVGGRAGDPPSPARSSRPASRAGPRTPFPPPAPPPRGTPVAPPPPASAPVGPPALPPRSAAPPPPAPPPHPAAPPAPPAPAPAAPEAPQTASRAAPRTTSPTRLPIEPDAAGRQDVPAPKDRAWRRRGVFAVVGGVAAVAAIAAVAVALSSGRGGGDATGRATPPAPGPVAVAERDRPSPAMGDAPAMEGAPPTPATPSTADPSAPRAAAVRSALAAAATAAAAQRWEDVRAQLAVARAAGAGDAAIPAALVTGLAAYDAPPRLDVVTPAEGAEIAESPVEVVVRFASGRPTDRVRVNGAPVLARADVFVAEVALARTGSVDVTVTVVDVGADGNGTTERRRVVRHVRYVPGPWVTFLEAFAAPEGSALDPATGYPTRIRRLRDGATMVLVPAGSFRMGATAGSASVRGDELPRHTVHVSHAYYLDATEVTVGAWRRFAKATGRRDAPPASVADELPMASVAFADAEAFAAWAGVRLPTEAQWERAARGGKDGEPFPWGAADDPKQRRVGATGPAPVGIFPANAFGLLDLVGNVAEWCADGYDPDAYRAHRALDPRGSDAWSLRVVRGGGWRAPEAATIARRVGVDPRVADDELGFRCARELP